MKIGMIIHSKTGHTLSVAEGIEQALLSLGHTVGIEQVAAVDESPATINDVQLKTAPDIEGYDALIFAAPVHKGGLSLVMKSYLSALPSLDSKRVALFVTQGFAYSFMGGGQAVGSMKKICKQKGANITKTGVINWRNKQRENQIADLIKNFKQI